MNKIIEMQVPTPQNTVLKDEQVAPMKMLYCKVSMLPKLFNISRATAYRILKEANEMEDYKGRISTDISQTLTLVHIETFEDFLRSKNKKYL